LQGFVDRHQHARDLFVATPLPSSILENEYAVLLDKATKGVEVRLLLPAVDTWIRINQYETQDGELFSERLMAISFHLSRVKTLIEAGVQVRLADYAIETVFIAQDRRSARSEGDISCLYCPSQPSVYDNLMWPVMTGTVDDEVGVVARHYYRRQVDDQINEDLWRWSRKNLDLWDLKKITDPLHDLTTRALHYYSDCATLTSG
jgi:hypothetical protein